MQPNVTQVKQKLVHVSWIRMTSKAIYVRRSLLNSWVGEGYVGEHLSFNFWSTRIKFVNTSRGRGKKKNAF